MKIVLICNEPPFPATHGGRVDVWRRLCAMRAAGVDIFLIFWSGDRLNDIPTKSALSRINQEASVIKFFLIHRTIYARFLRLLRLFRWPSHVASRVLTKNEKISLISEIKEFKPDAVWLESIYGGVIAKSIVDAFSIPLYLRSHNIEHLYIKKQVTKAIGFRAKLPLILNLLNLKDFELSLFKKSSRYFDISKDDLEFWKQSGFINGNWLPPTIDEELSTALSAPRLQEPEYDVGYLGNLYSPNNVDGIFWFLNKVVPNIRMEYHNIKIFIAGSNPIDSLRNRINVLGIDLILNPKDVVPVLRNARVLINPIFSGSGVNIKSVEMIYCPAEIISTSQGLSGLPTNVKNHFIVADTAVDFSISIINALKFPVTNNYSSRLSVRHLFSPSIVFKLIESLKITNNDLNK